MKVVVTQTVFGKCINVGCLDRGAVTTEISKSSVVQKDDEDMGG
jgi:hypothetical protein